MSGFDQRRVRQKTLSIASSRWGMFQAEMTKVKFPSGRSRSLCRIASSTGEYSLFRTLKADAAHVEVMAVAPGTVGCYRDGAGRRAR